jgi:hypothetical protein
MFFLVRLVRIVMILLVIRVVLRTIAGFLRPGNRPEKAGTASPVLAGDLVRDRVCNTFVLKDRAVRALVAGREESFCSALCRDKALGALSKAG